MAYKARKGDGKKIGRERIDILFALAGAWARQDMLRARRCIQIAEGIAMKHRLRIPRRYRRLFCRNCHIYLIPGHTSRVRIHHGRVVVTCLACHHRRRYPVVKQHP